MNKKKALIFGGSGVLAAVVIIGVIIVIISGGNDNKKEKKIKTTTSAEITTEIEKDTEETTEEQTTEEEPVVEEEPTQEQLEYREILKNQVFEVDYDSYKEAYLYMLRLYEKAYIDSDVKCSVVDFDGDDVSELVIDVNSGITMYTYKDSKVYKLIDDWGYGAGGNHGYDFIPGNGVIRNYNTDYAGLIMNETYIWVKLDGEEVVTEQRFLMLAFVDDVKIMELQMKVKMMVEILLVIILAKMRLQKISIQKLWWKVNMFRLLVSGFCHRIRMISLKRYKSRIW